MAPTYYVIELSARWLTVLLVALALVMVLAFAFGYGAAWSVLTSGEATRSPPPAGTPLMAMATPDAMDERVVDTPTLVPPTEPPPATAAASVTPVPVPTRVPPTAAPPPPSEDGYFVQVLASSTAQAMEGAEQKLAELGFSPDHRHVVTTQVAGGSVLYKLRVGPFPDRESADRVTGRMRASGFPDAWVVAP
jgi:cell division septation protein DedD